MLVRSRAAEAENSVLIPLVWHQREVTASDGCSRRYDRSLVMLILNVSSSDSAGRFLTY